MKFLLALLCTGLSFAYAQDSLNIKIDRPDQTDGTETVKQGKLQVEAEGYYNRFKNNEAAIISSTLLRYGLSKNLELRLLAEEGKNRDIFIEETAQGQYPLAIGAKLAVLKNEALLMLSLIGYIKLPFTSRTKQQQSYWSGTLLIAIERDINKLTLVANGGYHQNAYAATGVWQTSFNAKYAFTNRLEGYTEYFSQFDALQHPSHNADAGLVFFISHHLATHIAYGSSIFTHNYNRFVNTGLSFQL